MRSLSNLCLINSPPVLVPEIKKDTGGGGQMGRAEVGTNGCVSQRSVGGIMSLSTET